MTKAELMKLLEIAFAGYSRPGGDEVQAEHEVAAYIIALEQFDARDLRDGIALLLRGELDGFDGRFRPSPTQLALATREAQRRRDGYGFTYVAPPVPPVLLEEPIHKTTESKARVRALAAKHTRTRDAAHGPPRDHEKEAKAALKRHDEFWKLPTRDEAAMAERRASLDADLAKKQQQPVPPPVEDENPRDPKWWQK